MKDNSEYVRRMFLLVISLTSKTGTVTVIRDFYIAVFLEEQGGFKSNQETPPACW